jgi:hypothetical protein
MRVLAEDRTEWPGNITGRKGGSRDLIEERLKEMVIGAVDQDHIGIA